MKYRTKPFEIEAMQFTGYNFYDVQAWVGSREISPTWIIYKFQEAGTYMNWDDDDIVAEVYDELHSTWVGVKLDQFIIKGSKGEFYPCDPEIFNEKYEPIGQD